jgi:dipeptidyl aminopeptidase/acylaminoacyl peptidase
MLLRRLVVLVLFSLAAPLHAQTPPVEYETFVSQGKPISCAVYGPHEATATIIFLRGASPSDLSLGRLEARFFAEHGFRVLLPEYLSATPTAEPTVANYRRWAQVVEDIVVALRSSAALRNKKIGLAGQSQGASVALIAGTQRLEVEAMVEWSGLLPNQFFSQVQTMPPLLILHGELDKQVPIVNARQLVRLCQLRDFTCEIEIFAGEGHVFGSHVMDSANQRALAFFRVNLH